MARVKNNQRLSTGKKSLASKSTRPATNHRKANTKAARKAARSGPDLATCLQQLEAEQPLAKKAHRKAEVAVGGGLYKMVCDVFDADILRFKAEQQSGAALTAVIRALYPATAGGILQVGGKLMDAFGAFELVLSKQQQKQLKVVGDIDAPTAKSFQEPSAANKVWLQKATKSKHLGDTLSLNVFSVYQDGEAPPEDEPAEDEESYYTYVPAMKQGGVAVVLAQAAAGQDVWHVVPLDKLLPGASKYPQAHKALKAATNNVSSPGDFFEMLFGFNNTTTPLVVTAAAAAYKQALNVLEAVVGSLGTGVVTADNLNKTVLACAAQHPVPHVTISMEDASSLVCRHDEPAAGMGILKINFSTSGGAGSSRAAAPSAAALQQQIPTTGAGCSHAAGDIDADVAATIGGSADAVLAYNAGLRGRQVAMSIREELDNLAGRELTIWCIGRVDRVNSLNSQPMVEVVFAHDQVAKPSLTVPVTSVKCDDSTYRWYMMDDDTRQWVLQQSAVLQGKIKIALSSAMKAYDRAEVFTQIEWEERVANGFMRVFQK